MSKSPLPTATAILFLVGAASQALGSTVSLTTLDRSINVGQDDTSALVAPAAPGDGWFTGTHEATLRGRSLGNFEERRTQWYFAFDITALAGVDAGDIVSATITIPQVGRLNTLDIPTDHIKLYDPNFIWDTGGSNYPVWNSGRPFGTAPAGYPGGTTLADPLGGYNDYGLVTDTSNPNVEGNFTLANAALLATVQSWATNPADNEGFFMSYEFAHNMGLAFGTPTLEIEVIPEPATSGLLLLGLAMVVRRSRA